MGLKVTSLRRPRPANFHVIIVAESSLVDRPHKDFLWGCYGALYLDSQVAANNRPLYPKVGHYWCKVAQNYEPLALQVEVFVSSEPMNPTRSPPSTRRPCELRGDIAGPSWGALWGLTFLALQNLSVQAAKQTRAARLRRSALNL